MIIYKRVPKTKVVIKTLERNVVRRTVEKQQNKKLSPENLKFLKEFQDGYKRVRHI